MKTEAWDWYATHDPYYAVCSDPSKRKGGWKIEELYNLGETEVSRIAKYLDRVVQSQHQTVLDFGCGVGRLSRAFSQRFASYTGVDISSEMIIKARGLNPLPALEFLVANLDDLKRLPRKFDLIYSSLVFQHIEPPKTEEYLKALLNLLQPNGVFLFQTAEKYISPKRVSLKDLLSQARTAIKPRERLSRIAMPLGLTISRGEPGMDMYGISEARVRQTINQAGGVVQESQLTNSTCPNFNGNLQFLTQEPTEGWVSKQYLVTHNSS